MTRASLQLLKIFGRQDGTALFTRGGYVNASNILVTHTQGNHFLNFNNEYIGKSFLFWFFPISMNVSLSFRGYELYDLTLV